MAPRRLLLAVREEATVEVGLTCDEQSRPNALRAPLVSITNASHAGNPSTVDSSCSSVTGTVQASSTKRCSMQPSAGRRQRSLLVAASPLPSELNTTSLGFVTSKAEATQNEQADTLPAVEQVAAQVKRAASPCNLTGPSALRKPQKRSLLMAAPMPAQEAEQGEEDDGTLACPDVCYTVTFCRDAHKKRRAYSDGVMTVRNGKCYLYSDEGKHLHLGRTVRVDERLPIGRTIDAGPTTQIEITQELPIEEYVSGKVFARNLIKTEQRVAATSTQSANRQGIMHMNSATADVDKPPPSGSLPLGPGFFLEPLLASKLRPHQEEGVKFLFRHLQAGKGCILADSMGLGKTLQALCATWTALSQPFHRPLCRRAAIVCPSSLCGNWAAEAAKWLGQLRVKAAVVQGGSSAAAVVSTIRGWLGSSSSRPDGRLLIISYDQLRMHASSVSAEVDLLVCDEGHRLKNASASTTKVLSSLKCQKRLLLTGTPLQNNLDEFHCCCSFVQPDLLPPLPAFQLVFKKPIDRAQDSSASADEVALGNARSAELSRLTGTMLLRRGPEILDSLLPPRTELLLTATLAPPAAKAYRTICNMRAPELAGRYSTSSTSGSSAMQLELLSLLRQLCNDAEDLRQRGLAAASGTLPTANAKVAEPAMQEDDDNVDEVVPAPPAPSTKVLQLVHQAFTSSGANSLLEGATGKLRLLEALLVWIGQEYPNDGVVVVSSFMKSIRRCEEIASRLGFAITKLMGATPASQRSSLVDAFNRQDGKRAFLLSARAGGVGLNIIGANRLIMLEPDWNPAVDLQAMGRVWRQGQTKHVYIYRLATHGSVEEKILRRQSWKQGLANQTLEGSSENTGLGIACEDLADLKKVYVLEGYAETSGLPLPATMSGESDLPAAAGLHAAEVRAAWHSARLLSTTANLQASGGGDAMRQPENSAFAGSDAKRQPENSASGGSDAKRQPENSASGGSDAKRQLDNSTFEATAQKLEQDKQASPPLKRSRTLEIDEVSNAPHVPSPQSLAGSAAQQEPMTLIEDDDD
eukprot:TRINITY_DN5705_c0_g1_i1.p1 TRINITY_DN5705_c0_g1~~TRINITY_DN5705_c0_g1_i1.p1  ORF type:complete len:1050 (+),score=202.84 TRINITY_DN5705_c0_g1_i1:50-3151(+)